MFCIASLKLLLYTLLQMPKNSLCPLLRRLFLRLICLMGGTASTREWKEAPAGVAAVLAFKYGSVLLDILEGVRGASEGLYDDFIVEVTHLISTPQVREPAGFMVSCMLHYYCRTVHVHAAKECRLV